MAGDGDIMIEGCRNYSWRNIFYLQIWIEDEGILACLGQTWYLDNDMFFFAISLIMIYPIWKMPKLGLSLMGEPEKLENKISHQIFGKSDFFLNTPKEVTLLLLLLFSAL